MPLPGVCVAAGASSPNWQDTNEDEWPNRVTRRRSPSRAPVISGGALSSQANVTSEARLGASPPAGPETGGPTRVTDGKYRSFLTRPSGSSASADASFVVPTFPASDVTSRCLLILSCSLSTFFVTSPFDASTSSSHWAIRSLAARARRWY